MHSFIRDRGKRQSDNIPWMDIVAQSVTQQTKPVVKQDQGKNDSSINAHRKSENLLIYTYSRRYYIALPFQIHIS